MFGLSKKERVIKKIKNSIERLEFKFQSKKWKNFILELKEEYNPKEIENFINLAYRQVTKDIEKDGFVKEIGDAKSIKKVHDKTLALLMKPLSEK